jgi:hypothetical protein
MFDYTNDLLESLFKFVGVAVLGGFMGILAIFMNLILNIIIAGLFWLFWTVLGIGARYFGFLPNIYLNMSLWHCIGIFTCIELVKLLIFSKSPNVNMKE